jgi:flagellar motility protein MotE (MotC chaperone)
MPSWLYNSRIRTSWRLLAGIAAVAAVLAALVPDGGAGLANAADASAPPPHDADAPKVIAGVVPESLPAQYCANIVDKAADARFAEQKSELAKLQQAIDDRLQQLEKKRSDFELWLKRREDFLAKVQGNLSAVYAKMKPAAAAEELAQLDDLTAAAILLKLDPRATSSILAEMDPAKAAQLARLFASAGRERTGKCT